MNAVELIIPGFAPGQRLTADALNHLHHYHEQRGYFLSARMSDGIIQGLGVKTATVEGTDNIHLVLHPGAFKWQGHTAWLESPLPIENPPTYDSRPQILYLIPTNSTAITEANYGDLDHPYITTGTHRHYRLEWHKEPRSDAMELMRMTYTQGIRSKNHDITLDHSNHSEIPWLNMSATPAGVIDLRGVPYATLGQYPTLIPHYQRAIGQWIMDLRLYTLYFMVPDLLQGTFIICDFTQTNNLSDAIPKLRQFINESRQDKTPYNAETPELTPSKPVQRPVLGG